MKDQSAGAAVPLDPDDMAACAPRATSLCKALGHERRFAVLLGLARGECGLPRLEAITGDRRPALSQHLARLRAEGLVSARRGPQGMLYRLADRRAERLVRALISMIDL